MLGIGRRRESWESMGGDRRRSSIGRRLFLLVVVALLVWGGLITWRMGGTPEARIESDLPAIGRLAVVTVRVEEPGRGLARVAIDLVQGDQVTNLLDGDYGSPPMWAPWRSLETSRELTVEVGRDKGKLAPGEATIRVTAWGIGTWWRSPEPATVRLTLPVRLRPPSLGVRSIRNYAAQGGTGVVVYQVGPSAVRDGVQVDEEWFPGHPLPAGGAGERFALFAVPFDLEDETRIRLVAADDALNEAEVPFLDRLLRKPYRTDTISLSQEFLARVVPAILSQTPELEDQGDLLQNYLEINGNLRGENAETLRRLATSSPAEFLWSEPFVAMPGSQVMSSFADRRTYVLDGQEVDRQNHLGFDLASVRRASVPAANTGVVVLARYFGIYGNAVVVDHGFGLMSLYGHLSTIAVEEGQEVDRGDLLGRTGTTGLSGGDHLHFSMLLQGLPVTPLEWWDGRWIEDRVMSKLTVGEIASE